MRSLLLGLLGTVSATAAIGADMQIKARPAPAAVIAYNWSGLYIGAHIGYAWATSDITNINGSVAFPAGTRSTHDFDGVIGGGQIGFNYQVAPYWVLGTEGDFSWSGVDGVTRNVSTVNPAVVSVTNTKVDWLATLTGRVGYAVNNWLWYVKGGAAWAEIKGSFRATNAGVLNAAGSGSETRSGWTVGAGVEYGWGNWSGRFEYNYVDFGTDTISRTVTFAAVAIPNPLLRSSDAYMHAVKLGLNYRFGWTGR
jgi:outer membrane immunogenic protein